MKTHTRTDKKTHRTVRIQAMPSGYLIWDEQSFGLLGTVHRYGATRKRWRASYSCGDGGFCHLVAKSLNHAIELLLSN